MLVSLLVNQSLELVILLINQSLELVLVILSHIIIRVIIVLLQLCLVNYLVCKLCLHINSVLSFYFYGYGAVDLCRFWLPLSFFYEYLGKLGDYV